MTADNYAPATSLTGYYASRQSNRPVRHWATEKLIHDLNAIGLLNFFEGPGPNPMALDGASTAKLWLDTDAGVTATSGTFKRYIGFGSTSDEANWIAVTPGAYLLHLGGLSPVTETEDYTTRAVAAAATIASSTTHLRTAGYADIGDGGGWLYKKVGGDPGNAAAFQSADGAWWNPDLNGITVEVYGGLGDGSTDNDDAIEDMVDHVGYVVFGAGDHYTTSVTIDGEAHFESGAKLTIPTANIVTFRRAIHAPRQQIFDGAGTVSLSLDGTRGEESKMAHVSWWGVFPGAGLGDQGPVINKATAAFGNTREGILYFDNGVYGTNEKILVPRGLTITGIGTRKTLFYPLTDGFACFETQGVAAHWIGIQFEVNRDVTPSRVSPYINILHGDALVRDVMLTNGENAIVVDATGVRIENIGFNHDQQNGASGSALITVKKSNCLINGVYGFLGLTYGPENIVLVAPTGAKCNGVTIRNIDTRARPRPVKVVTDAQSITRLTINGIAYDATVGSAPDNAIEIDIAGGTYIQGVNITDININDRPTDGMLFAVADDGILEMVNIDNVNILGSTSPSARNGIEFTMGAGTDGAIRGVHIGRNVNIVRPTGQKIVVPVDSRVHVDASPDSGIGYTTGVGGTQTQSTNKSTGVGLDKLTGTITMNNATLNAGTTVGFTLSNNTIAATDIVLVNIKSGATANSYSVAVTAVTNGSCVIELRNTSGGNLSEAVVLSFAVLKSVAA